MARAFEGRPARPSAPARAGAPVAPARAMPPARDFAQLASRLHLGAPVQRRLGSGHGPGPDLSGIAAPGRPSAPGGLPTALRAEVEARSGLPMGDVRVHRGSDRPARIGALAYAQGRDIHLGPGQDRLLGHEAWHVVQQKQGRVRATGRAGGMVLNDEARLEDEARTWSRQPFTRPAQPQKPSQYETRPVQMVREVTVSIGHHTLRFRGIPENDQTEAKARQLLQALASNVQLMFYLDGVGKDCVIDLVGASRNVASVNANGGTVMVELSAWYFHSRSIGDIIGMLNHEFGIHPYADVNIDLAEENRINVPVGRMQQRDHLLGARRDQPRNRQYREFVLGSARALADPTTRAAATPAERTAADEQIRHILHIFIIDCAWILQTNDRRILGPIFPRAIAAEYNAIRNRLSETLRDDYSDPETQTVRNAMPRGMTAWSVFVYFFTVIIGMLLGIIRHAIERRGR